MQRTLFQRPLLPLTLLDKYISEYRSGGCCDCDIGLSEKAWWCKELLSELITSVYVFLWKLSIGFGNCNWIRRLHVHIIFLLFSFHHYQYFSYFLSIFPQYISFISPISFPHFSCAYHISPIFFRSLSIARGIIQIKTKENHPWSISLSVSLLKCHYSNISKTHLLQCS